MSRRAIGSPPAQIGWPAVLPRAAGLLAGAEVSDAPLERDPGKRLSLHSLRHSRGSLWLAHGVQLAAVSAWLGHRKISTTERWYAHQLPSLLDTEADRMRDRANGVLTGARDRAGTEAT